MKFRNSWLPALLACFALYAAVAAAPAAAATCQDRPCINVGAFNIKLFGGGPTTPANTRDEYRAIARLLASTMDLDVFVLEEINVRSPDWADLKRELEASGYRIAFEGGFGGELSQFLVIGFRPASVQLIGPAPRDLDFPTTYTEAGSSSCTYPNIRPPVAASFRAGSFDFHLIGVHLKSNRTVEGSDARCDDRIRTDQARRIVGYMAQLPGGERDAIVLGDFNSTFALPENNPFREAGFRSAMDDRAPGSGDRSFVTGGMIDQIVVRSDDASYVRGSGFAFRVTQAERAAYLRSVSDHVPIRASFYTDRDAD